MKLINKALFAAVSLSVLAAFGLASCSDGFSGSTTTYDPTTKVSAPELTVKAYPGVNVVSWNVVKNATDYLVYKTVGNNPEVLLSSVTSNTTSNPTLFVTDTVDEAILAKTGVTYKYRVVANTTSNTKFEANESTKSVTTKGSPADIGTVFSALNSANFETSFDSKATQLSDSVISVSQLDENGNITVAFPVKAYAKYTVTVVNDDVPEVLLSSTTRDAQITIEGAAYENNAIAVKKIAVTSAGTKTISVKADPYYEGYTDETFTASKTVTVAALESITNAASTASANWTSATTARIYWQPATFDASGETVPTSYYRVYRKNADGSYTTVSGVTAGGDATNAVAVYYVDDTIDNNAVSYTYTIVVTDGTNYGTSLTKTLDAYGTTGQTNVSNIDRGFTTYIGDNDNLKNDVQLVVKNLTAKQTLVSAAYVLTDGVDETHRLYASSDFTPITVENYDSYNYTYTLYIKDLPIDTDESLRVVFKFVIAEDGKESATVYKQNTISAVSVSSPTSITATPVTTGTTTTTYSSVTLTVTDTFSNSDTDKVGNYTYTVYRVRTTTANNSIRDEVTVSSTKVGTVTLALSSGSTTSYTGSVTDAVNITVPATPTGSLEDFWYVVKERVDNGVSKKYGSVSTSEITYY